MFRSSLKWKWALAALVATLGGTSAYAQTAACQVNYTQAWSGGNAHGANVQITNLGAPINGWTLTFNFPGGQTLQNGWPVSVTQSGATLTAASNAPWNASIPTNGSFTVGFNANGAFAVPASFTLNGVACTGGGGPQNPVNTAPTVSISAPANNSSVTIGQPINVAANAADTNAGGAVQRVEFRRGTLLVSTDTSAPYTASIPTTGLAAGPQTISATAFDNGVPAPVMMAQASITVNLVGANQNTAPTVQITAPLANANVAQGTALPVSANAADTNAGGAVVRVDFRLDGAAAVAATDATSPYTGSIATAGLAVGPHSVCATSVDNGVPAPQLSSTQSCVTFNVTGVVQRAVQAVPNSVTVPAGGSATAVIRLSVAPPANAPVTVTIARNAGGNAAIGPATQTVQVTSANNAAGVTATFTAAAGTGAASAAFTASAPNSTSVLITVSRGTGPGGPNALFRVANGRVTKNGALFPVHCGSWFGLEGRHEPSTDPVNPRGAAMEQYIGNTSWVNGGGGSGRTVAQTMQQIAGMGLNVIRLPMVPQTLSTNDPQGTGGVLKNHSSVRAGMENSRVAFETMIRQADLANIEVMLDVHSCSNYVGWRKGRFDARPPYADFDRDNYDFKREDSSCAATGNPAGVTQISAYNETLWRANLRTLAGMSASLGVDNIIGIDIFNEPHDYTWAEWKRLTEVAFAEIDAVNPNILLFVQGIGTNANTQDGTPTTISVQPHGVLETNPNWGENLFEQRTNPINVPQSRIVFSPHTYGPSVFVQKMFMDPAQTACTGLEGDAAGNADCRIVINPTLLRAGWEEHFGYLKQLGYAVVVGEYGGNLDWPQGQAAPRDRDRWSHITPGVDGAWQNAFTDYMISKGIEGCYWSINPESGDTAGWYGHAYHPLTNTSGWGEWLAFDARKTTLLSRLWQGVP